MKHFCFNLAESRNTLKLQKAGWFQFISHYGERYRKCYREHGSFRLKWFKSNIHRAVRSKRVEWNGMHCGWFFLFGLHPYLAKVAFYSARDACTQQNPRTYRLGREKKVAHPNWMEAWARDLISRYIYIAFYLCVCVFFFSSILYLCVFRRTALFVAFGFPFQI